MKLDSIIDLVLQAHDASLADAPPRVTSKIVGRELVIEREPEVEPTPTVERPLLECSSSPIESAHARSCGWEGADSKLIGLSKDFPTKDGSRVEFERPYRRRGRD